MKASIRILLLASGLLLGGVAQAGVVVVAHPAIPVANVTARDVAALYMGRTHALPGGVVVRVVDFEEGVAVREEFIGKVLGKSEQQLRDFWARQVFTGKARPPRTVASVEEMVRTIASTPGAVGYLDSKDVPASMKVIYRAE